MESDIAQIFAVHPSFRIVATATPPSTSNPWLTNEVMHLFHFHSLDETAPMALSSLLKSIVPSAPLEILKNLEKFSKKLNELCEDPTVQLGTRLSLRQLIRLAKTSADFAEEIYEGLCGACMVHFMPSAKKELVLKEMKELGFIQRVKKGGADAPIKISYCDAE